MTVGPVLKERECTCKFPNNVNNAEHVCALQFPNL